MGLLRSEEMSHGTLVLPNDRAREFIDLLGRKAHIQFLDMNANTTNRPYRKQIARIDELERILRCLFDQIEKLDATVESGHVDSFLAADNDYSLDNVEAALQQLYVQFVRFDANNTNLKKERDLAIYEKYVLLAAAATYQASALNGGIGSTSSYSNQVVPNQHEDDYMNLLAGSGAAASTQRTSGLSFNTIAGVIPKADQDRFGRILFKATRGNCFTFCHPVEDETVHEKDRMTVFVVYYQGSSSSLGGTSAMKEKIEKIAKTFGAKSFPWPATLGDAQDRLRSVEVILQEKQAALDGYERYFVSQIAILLETKQNANGLPGNSLIEEWRLFAVKEKALYATLNMFEGEDMSLRARCWFPKSEEGVILQLLNSQGSSLESPALLFIDHEAGKPKPSRGHGNDDKTMIPPTFYKSNSIMLPFQMLVDTYGIPRYMEANPALTATIMFPFLFGVMYGDIGHGLILFSFAAYLCINNNSIAATKDSALKGFLPIRYMFLLMGFFAVYAGFIYNDFMAVGHDFLGKTSYVPAPNDGTHPHGEFIRPEGAPVYPFGLDPIWKGASNELTFVNSMKMKFAIIVGVFHMIIGICMKGMNARFFGAPEDFLFEFVPQLIFMIAMFGYLVLLIVVKWCQDINAAKPQLITTLIDMFLSAGSEIPKDQELIAGQSSLQIKLVMVVILCIPVMLLPKPFYLKWLHEKEQAAHKAHSHGSSASHRQLESSNASHSRSTNQNANASTHQPAPAVAGRVVYNEQHGTEQSHLLSDVELGGGHLADGGEDHSHQHHFDFGEVFVHQMIETIEFAMGAVSNSASYLRLWALSLAHAQLSLVFYERLMLIALESSANIVVRTILTFVCFAAFMTVTTGVILMMDVLECFLHALRLQWVEFQNKFYKADGYKFVPYSHKDTLIAASTASEE